MSNNNQISFFNAIAAGMVLAASIAWSNAMQAVVIYYYPDGSKSQVTSKIVFAIILTLIIVILSRYL
jgi:hypothetical protein